MAALRHRRDGNVNGPFKIDARADISKGKVGAVLRLSRRDAIVCFRFDSMSRAETFVGGRSDRMFHECIDSSLCFWCHAVARYMSPFLS